MSKYILCTKDKKSPITLVYTKHNKWTIGQVHGVWLGTGQDKFRIFDSFDSAETALKQEKTKLAAKRYSLFIEAA